MVHYRNSLKAGKEYEESHVFGYEEKYWEAIRKEKNEYENILALDYYMDRYNLYLRMDRQMEEHLLFSARY